jgi:hypothetical protein
MTKTIAVASILLISSSSSYKLDQHSKGILEISCINGTYKT